LWSPTRLSEQGRHESVHGSLDDTAQILGKEISEEELGRPADGTVFNTTMLDKIMSKPMRLVATIPEGEPIDED